MSMGEPHAHIRESTESLSASSFILCFRFFVSFVSPSAIANSVFSVVLNVPHLPRIVVLIQYVSAWENVVSMEESHEYGRTTWAYGGVTGVTFRFA